MKARPGPFRRESPDAPRARRAVPSAHETSRIAHKPALDTRAQQDHEFDLTVGFGLSPIDGCGDAACGDPIAGGTHLLYALRPDDRVSLRMHAHYLIDESAWAMRARSVVDKLP